MSKIQLRSKSGANNFFEFGTNLDRYILGPPTWEQQLYLKGTDRDELLDAKSNL